MAAAQEMVVSGTIADTAGIPVTGANILIEGINKGTTSAANGYFELTLPSGHIYIITVSHIAYARQQQTIDLRKPSARHSGFKIILHHQSQEISEIAITATRPTYANLQKLETKYVKHLPNPSGGIEALLKTLPGVSSNNELSSQYSVRGGNFDENLVYVDDIEIHRPILIRSGQQEGLGFINPDLTASVDFSAGGFDARYGDKMSSVLDVHYRKPTNFASSASLSLLGASASVEGLAAKKRFSYITGARYKTSQYLLGTMDAKGQYNPDFIDIQGRFNYLISNKWSVSLLANAAQNKYRFIPESRSTNFGTLFESYNLNVYYDGQEIDRYNSGLGALTLHFYPTPRLSLKLTGSAYRSHEQETFDIEAAYRLSELESGADSTLNIGIGSELSHARNYLDSKIDVLSHIGMIKGNNRSLRWSVDFRQERTNNILNEWIMADSAGYSLPHNGAQIKLRKSVYADNRLVVHRITSSLQYVENLTGNYLNWTLTAGLRLNYNDVNHEWLISPRASVQMQPKYFEALTLHLATGLYGQPPSYSELRNAQGVMHQSIKAQRSIHYVAGATYVFQIANRPFKLSTELYYKQLSRMIPYKLENVRIYYAGDNMASGYVAGWDIKLNGEIVPGAESWASFSLMHARADISGDEYGAFPLPTDQWANFNLFFQDYIPGAPSLRVYLNLAFGSALPYNQPVTDRYDLTFRMPAYRRVDIGLSKEFFNKEKPHKFFKQIWLNAEIFNLFDTNNTISYLWVQVVSNQNGLNQQYAIPNYLTARRINVKLNMMF